MLHCRPNPLKQFYPDEVEEEEIQSEIVRVDILPLSAGDHILPNLTLFIISLISILL